MELAQRQNLSVTIPALNSSYSQIMAPDITWSMGQFVVVAPGDVGLWNIPIEVTSRIRGGLVDNTI